MLGARTSLAIIHLSASSSRAPPSPSYSDHLAGGSGPASPHLSSRSARAHPACAWRHSVRDTAGWRIALLSRLTDTCSGCQDGSGGSWVTCSGGLCDLWKPHGPCPRLWLPHSVPHNTEQSADPTPASTPAFPAFVSQVSFLVIHILFSFQLSLSTHFGNSGTVWPPCLHRHPPQCPLILQWAVRLSLAPSASQHEPSELACLHRNPGSLAISKTDRPGCGQIV